MSEKENWTIQGNVTRAGRPCAGVKVAAFDRDLRKRQPLGKPAVTGDDGTFRIEFTTAEFALGDRKARPAPWLVVEATEPGGGRTVAVERPRGVQQNETVNLAFPADVLSDFEEIERRVAPLLEGQAEDGGALQAWELKPEDLAFIVKETTLEPHALNVWALAARAAREVALLGKPPGTGKKARTSERAHVREAARPAPPEAPKGDRVAWLAFYAWFMERQSTAAGELVRRHPDELVALLVRAAGNGRIPALSDADLARVRQALEDRRVSEALKPAGKNDPASLGTVLSAVGGTWLTPDLQRKVAPVLLDVPVESDDFLRKLEPLVPNESRRRDLRRTLRLSQLTRAHAPMIEALQPTAMASGDDTIRGLASVPLDRWIDLAWDHGVPPASSLTPVEYAREMEEEVERKAPTATLAARIETHPFLSSTPSYAALIPALQKHSSFDVSSGDIEAFAKDARLEPAQQRALHRLQHLKRLGTRWDEAGTLLERGIESVQQIVDLGPGGFQAEMGDLLDAGRIGAIYRQSQAMHVVSVGLMGAMQPLMFPQAGRAMTTQLGKADPTSAQIAASPTLRRLFGSLETCTCGHCRSVLGPAAYLVDLLKFIDASPAAASELRMRRPDLYDLDLSCDNSQIELAHIDLVNEILENKVTFPLTVSLPPGVSAEAEIKRVPLGAPVRSQLQRTSEDPIGELTAVEDRWSMRPKFYLEGTSFWVVTDRHRRWVLQASTEGFWVVSSPHAAKLDPAGLNVADVLAAFNQGTVHASVRQRFEQALIDTQRPLLPLAVEDVTIAAVEEGRWTVTFSLVGRIVVKPDEGTLVLSATPGVEDRRPYSAAALRAAESELASGEMAMLVRPANEGLARAIVVSTVPEGWRYRSTHTATVIYRPSALTINGLTYQSTVRGEDLLTRAQNRNPLAHEMLNSAAVRFPWTLPYDDSLGAVRALLSKAGAPRRALLDLAKPPNRASTPMSIVSEALGLSAEEILRIRTEASGDDLWAVWGLKKPSQATGPFYVFDTFADRMMSGTGNQLLERVSVLMQQARVSFLELRQLLASRWVNPDALRITPDHLCDPTELSVAVTEGVLDRLHRFVRLWRALGWQIWEVDLALRAPAIAVDGLGDGTFRNLAHLKQLEEALDQPMEVLLTWLGGSFASEGHVYELKGELLEARSLHERLFFDRRLSRTRDRDLEFAAINPPAGQTPPRTLEEKVSAIATALGVRESIVRDLVASTAVDPGGIAAGRRLTNRNLVWVYRHAVLLTRRRLAVDQYEAAWRVRAGDPFASPGALLDFLDDLEHVRRSGTTWRTLEYVLRGTGAEDTAFSAAQASPILASIQRSLAAQQPPEPVLSRFGLTTDSLTDPALSSLPANASERWRRWGLAPAQTGSDWTVQNPDAGAANPVLSGQPLALLSRVAVLAQQLRANAGEVRALLQTRFVVPDGAAPLAVAPAGGANPEPIVSNLTATHLDRLERLASLWRRAGLGIRELDLLIRATAVTNPAEPLLDDLVLLVDRGSAIVALRDRLGVPLDVAIAWQGGLAGRAYRKFTPAGADDGPENGVFERAFGGIPALALAPDRQRLSVEAAPPAAPPSWAGLFPAIAPALKVPISELAFLAASGALPEQVSLANLETIHRLVSLATALGVTAREFARFARRFSRVDGRDWKSSPAAMLAYVEATLDVLQRSEAIASQIAGSMQLESDVASDVLWDALDVPEGASRVPAMEMLLGSPRLVAGAVQDPASLTGSREYAVLVRLEKLRLLNEAWKGTPIELRWLWRDPAAIATFAGLSLNALPVTGNDAAVPFLEWRRTTALFTMAHAAPAVAGMLGAYLTAVRTARSSSEIDAGFTTIGVAYGLLQAAAAAEVARFARLLGLDGVAAPPTEPPQLDPSLLASLIALVAMARRLGVDAAAFETLTAEPATAESVSVARGVLRARFGDQSWSNALRDANDIVRESARERLADYLVWREGVRNADALYERYLIDVQMGACMKTTRLLQSIAAAQLFVQRCLLNLEPRVRPDSIPNRERWEWMRNYRVWEANRKVFLYPENWLYPELRDDRTETFRAFESALMQSEPSDENAASALRQYLDDLVDVAQITTFGLYEHLEEPNDLTLYLVGRSQNPPYRFFWRKANPYGVPGTRWTSWERIDADLSGDHAIPFVLGGDFHVAWPIVKQVQRNEKDYFELQLAVAGRGPNGWTKRQISRDTLAVEKFLYRSERTTFALRLRVLRHQQAVAIDVRSVVKPSLPGVRVDYPDTFRITRVTYHKGKFQSYYWNLKLTVNSFTKYRDTGRIAAQPCSVVLEGIQLDPGYPTQFRLIPYGQYGPVTAADLAQIQLPIPGDVLLTVKASFTSPNGEVFESIPVSFDFDDTNPDLVDGTPNWGDSLEAVVTLLIPGPDDPMEPGEFDPLDMAPLGSFVLEEAREMQLNRVFTGAPLVHRPGFLSASSGHLEASEGTLGFLPAAAASGAGKLFALESCPSSTGFGYHTTYLEESRNKWLIRIGSSLLNERRLAIYTASFDDAGNYKLLGARDVGRLLSPDAQQAPINTLLGVGSLGDFVPPSAQPKVDPRKSPLVQFDLSQPNASYNWEVFFHVPIAASIFLSRQQRFEDARKWFHFVFDPTTSDTGSGRERFWRFLPFRHGNQPDTITQLLEALGGQNVTGTAAADVQQQVSAWLADPFNPFAVARLRPSAFEWYTVISYVKNLIAWGDQLFRRDTRESVHDATLLYVLAANVLGRRPEKIPKRGADQVALSYRALEGRWDDFGNKWLSLADNPLVQAWIAFLLWLAEHGVANPQPLWDQIAQLSSIGSLYFCVPPNEKLPELWDTVDDRLFKIRHCQNIDGVRRELPFFEPPIDPELLIRARAAGLDLADVLADRFAPLPTQRFQVLVQKANEFCGEVKSLGATLLSTLEKKEAEQLALIRSQQELEMLKLVEEVRSEQADEAQANIDALEKTRRNAIDRFTYLQRQLGKSELTFDAEGTPIVEQALMLQVQASGAPGDLRSLALVHGEVEQVKRLQESHVWSMVSGAIKAGSGVAHVAAAAAAAPYPYDSPNKALSAVGQALSAIGDGLALIATNASFWERRAALVSGWQRRRDEWVQQSKMAAEEIRQIDKQLIALKIRKSIVEKELANHRKQIEFTANVDDYIRRSKFTRASLYAWMESQLAEAYFSAYRLAYDLARRAERAYRFELGDETASFVRYGHWDGLRKGLLAGERLGNDLKRMEAAYLDRNKRELEITRHVSLRQLDPLALAALRGDGECEFDLPEALFDIDFPGHYYRRVKTVSVSIPSVVGPYTSVSGTLTLLSSRLREKARATGDYADEENYRIGLLPIQSIATSMAQNDPGMFELNFRDERYLPFEGAGAISKWRFTLPAPEFKAFDYETISDVILHVRYTARDGGEELKAKAQGSLVDRLNAMVQGEGASEGLAAMFPLRQDFQLEWRRFRDGQADLTMRLTELMFPYIFRSRVKVRSSQIVWTGQTAPVSMASDNADLPTYTVELSDGTELRAATDPYLIVSYQI
jgi:hypothetical protein